MIKGAIEECSLGSIGGRCGYGEVRTVQRVPTTSPERGIVDSLEAGIQSEQVELTVGQALERGLTTPRRLRAAATERPDRVRRFH